MDSRNQSSITSTRWKMTKADNLKSARIRMGYSKAEAARVLGVSDRTYDRWEKGDMDLPAGVIGELLESDLWYRHENT